MHAPLTTKPICRIVQGDCRELLAKLPDNFIQCVVTSPPYWGLRDYKLEPTVWDGNKDCAHEWGDEQKAKRQRYDSDIANSPKQQTQAAAVNKQTGGNFCAHCSAWLGTHGLEPTYQLYLQHSTQIFREVRRVLRPDGILWLNIGDSYAATTKGSGGTGKGTLNCGPELNAWSTEKQKLNGTRTFDLEELKPKDLCGIPWRLALALQEDGWYLRQDIIWHKPNPMPESVTDRCTKAHEYLFMLTKSPKYYFDAEAIKEAVSGGANAKISKKRMAEVQAARDAGSNSAAGFAQDRPKKHAVDGMVKQNESYENAVCLMVEQRNARSVWTISTKPYPEAHFATFPPDLVAPCIKASTPEHGCCSLCKMPWKRIFKKVPTGQTQKMADGWNTGPGGHGTIHPDGREAGEPNQPVMVKQTIGWQPACKCDAAPVPSLVLDPFAGSGTVGMVANQLNRHALLFEQSAPYVELARKRCGLTPPVA